MSGVPEEPVLISASVRRAQMVAPKRVSVIVTQRQNSASEEWSLLSSQASDPELGWGMKLYTHVGPPKASRLLLPKTSTHGTQEPLQHHTDFTQAIRGAIKRPPNHYSQAPEVTVTFSYCPAGDPGPLLSQYKGGYQEQGFLSGQQCDAPGLKHLCDST